MGVIIWNTMCKDGRRFRGGRVETHPCKMGAEQEIPVEHGIVELWNWRSWAPGYLL
jgi:hypothetical protein